MSNMHATKSAKTIFVIKNTFQNFLMLTNYHKTNHHWKICFTQRNLAKPFRNHLKKLFVQSFHSQVYQIELESIKNALL